MDGLSFTLGDVIAVATSITMSAISYGALRQRVKTLEEEMSKLDDLPERLARIETRQEVQTEYLRDLAANTRWMRDTPAYEPKKGRPSGSVP